MVNTATGGWNQHCATRNAHNLSLGPYINKATVKAFVRARAPQLRLAELLAYTEAAHLNYTDFVNQSYALQLEIVHEYERAHTFACSNRTRLCGWECGGRFGCADLHRKLPYSCFRG